MSATDSGCDATAAKPAATPTEAAPHRVEAFFGRLGDAIAARVGEDRDAVYANLERVAAEQLQAFAAYQQITQADLTDYVLSASRFCNQADLDGKFGEPPLSLYRAEHFDISVLTWLDGTTSIHQHAFCGAFQVLVGSSIHSRYRFAPWQPPAAMQRAVAGQLELIDIEVLKPGDTRVISRGDALIHALFHMDRPSLSIVVRTITDDPDQVQYDYRWPGLAVDPHQRHVPSIRKQQYLRMLRQLDDAQATRHLLRVLADADLFLAYQLISDVVQITVNPAELSILCAACNSLPKNQRELLAQTAHNDMHSRTLVALRRKLHEPGHRLLLALLLNVFDRARLLALVQRETGYSDPVAKVLDWIAEMTGQREGYDNLIGLDFRATEMRMLELMLRGKGYASILSGFEEQYGAVVVDNQRGALLALFRALRKSPLFFQLFHDLSDAEEPVRS